MLTRLLEAWRLARREIETLALWEMLHRRGTRRLADHAPHALMFAVERCTACRQVEACARLLKAGSDRAVDEFCPNTMYLRHLDAMRRHAGHCEAVMPPST